MQRCAIEYVAKLAHVARPRVSREFGERAGRELARPHLWLKVGEKPRRQRRQIAATLAQRGNIYDEDREPLVEVLTKEPLGDAHVQRCPGRAHHPHIDFTPSPPQGAHLTGFEHPQELHLQVERELALSSRNSGARVLGTNAPSRIPLRPREVAPRSCPKSSASARSRGRVPLR